MKTRSKDQLSLLFEADPVEPVVPDYSTHGFGNDYLSGLLEQIKRDRETLALPVEFHAPDAQFYQDRITSYQRAYQEAQDGSRSESASPHS
jgi:hypothetical protein